MSVGSSQSLFLGVDSNASAPIETWAGTVAVRPERTRQVMGITVRRHWAAAVGVLFLHAFALLALMQERRMVVRPETVTTVLLINTPPQMAPPDVPKPPALARIMTHLVFDAPPLPDIVEVAEPSTAQSMVAISSTPAAAPPTPSGPVSLTNELAVFCPSRTAPAYPAQSRHLREQGEVTLRVELDERGYVSDVRVERSSGFSRLDEAARTAVLSWRCQPAIRDGQSTPAVAIQNLEFKLERR